MKLTKTKHVWRTEHVTECDVVQGSATHHRAYPGNVGIARIFSMAEHEFGTGISIKNIKPAEKVYYMSIGDFKEQAAVANKADLD